MSGCPDSAELEALFRGTLGEARRRTLEGHLDGCDSCAQTVSELARLFGSATWGGPARPSADPEAPAQAGRYRLTRRLGAGGMGVVFEAHDPELDRAVAIKLLHPSADARDMQERLLREARAMARLAHPNVVAVFDVGRMDEHVFVAMELVEGRTLTRWLASTPRPSFAAIIGAFAGAGRGLEAAHAIGLVHRDFKPDNVLIGADGRPRVTDFGLALTTERSPETDPGSPSQRTLIAGTPAYMSPEQWRGQPADARSDQFSFCVALHEALFERRPFADSARRVLDGQPDPPPRSAPSWLRELLARGLAREPGDRYPDMRALLDELERRRNRRPLWFGLAAAVAAVGLGGAWLGGAWALQSSTAEPTAPEQASARDTTPTQGEACEAALADARGRFTASRREALADHLRAMDDGEVLATRALELLDRWSAAWTDAASGLCRDGPESQARCLDARLLRFDALVQQALDRDGFEIADTLLTAAYQLPAPSECVDAARFPSAEPVRAEVGLLLADLAALDVLIALELWSDAAAEADGALERAEALDDEPALAEALLAHGRVASAQGRSAQAIVGFERALTIAQAGGHERVEAEAALALVVERGVIGLDSRDAARWQRRAGGFASRVTDPEFEGRLALANARVLIAAGEAVQGAQSLDAAESVLTGPIPQLELELERAAVGLALGQLDDAGEAAERAATLARTKLGTGRLLAQAELARAKLAVARGELDRAVNHAEAAAKAAGVGRSLQRDALRGLALAVIGEVALARGDLDGARQHYARTRALLLIAPASALPAVWLARVELRAGSVAEGLRLLDEARRELDSTIPADDPRRLDLLEAIGQAELEAGAHARARATLSSALELADAALGFGPRRSFILVALARVEHDQGDAARAFALLEQAHVGLAGGLGLHHPRVTDATLMRADLAWALGKREHAQGLYRVALPRATSQRGPDDPATIRARERSGSE